MNAATSIAATSATTIGTTGTPLPPTAADQTARGRRLTRPLLAAVAAVAAVGALAGAVRYGTARKEAPVHYESAKVDRGPLTARVNATGSVSALVTVSVGSQVSGRIESLGADFGSAVRQGQVVATIDPSLFLAAVAQSRANLGAARANHDQAVANQRKARRDLAREKVLLAQALVAQADFDAMDATASVADAVVESTASAIDQARAALGQAQLNLDYCTIRSPIDGVVISRNVDVGQTVAASFQAPTLFTIAQDLTKMQVDTNVAEGDVGKITAGMPVTFTVDAYPDRAFPGTVRQVRDNATTVQNVVTYDAVIDVANPDLALKPVMTASVTFPYATRTAALRVPNAALRFKPDAATIRAMTGAAAVPEASAIRDGKPGQRIVWVLLDGRASPRVVRVGLSDGERTEVLEGDVREGDDVVAEATVSAGRAAP